MAWACLDCGSLEIRESGTYFETRALSSVGVYEIQDSDYGDDWEQECYDCKKSHLIEFDEEKLAENDLKTIFSFGEQKITTLLHLLFCCARNTKTPEVKKEFIKAFNDVFERNLVKTDVQEELHQKMLVEAI